MRNATYACLLTCIGLLLTVPCVGAESTDWIYPAAGLLQEFERISALSPDAAGTRAAYARLSARLDGLAQNSDPAAPDGRAQAAFAAWLGRRVQDQIGNAESAERLRTEYARRVEAMPESERLLFRVVFERLSPPQGVRSDAVCDIQRKGDEVKVRLVNYPIAWALRRIAESFGAEIGIPESIIGVADHDAKESVPLQAALLNIAAPRGLWVRPNPGGDYSVVVRDPLYMASIAEMADKRARLPTGATREPGIAKGYVLLHGHYIPPPYRVEVREEDYQCTVRLNGIVVHRGIRWIREPVPVVPLPSGGQFTDKDKDNNGLTRYVGQQYAAIRRAKGKAAAVQEIEAFLKGQRIVKRFEFTGDGEALDIWFQHEPDVRNGVLLYTFMDTPTTAQPDAKPQESAERKKRAQADAEEMRKQIEQCLASGGVVIVPSKLPPKILAGADAEKAIRAILTALQEIYRQRDRLHETLFGTYFPEDVDWAWETLLNLRFRELAQRWEMEHPQLNAK